MDGWLWIGMDHGFWVRCLQAWGFGLWMDCMDWNFGLETTPGEVFEGVVTRVAVTSSDFFFIFFLLYGTILSLAIWVSS
jgi:hypothetical protein